jgi:hypothetical protein
MGLSQSFSGHDLEGSCALPNLRLRNHRWKFGRLKSQFMALLQILLRSIGMMSDNNSTSNRRLGCTSWSSVRL